MKNTIMYPALAAALLFAAGPQVQDLAAADSGNSAVQQRDDGSRTEDRGRETMTPKAVLAPGEQGFPEKQKESPQKKPRLKYRDQSKCSC
jgi:hypothetical protein